MNKSLNLTEAQYRILAQRMVEEHRKYGDKLREGHWAEIAARKVVSHLKDFAASSKTDEQLYAEAAVVPQEHLDMMDARLALLDLIAAGEAILKESADPIIEHSTPIAYFKKFEALREAIERAKSGVMDERPEEPQGVPSTERLDLWDIGDPWDRSKD